MHRLGLLLVAVLAFLQPATAGAQSAPEPAAPTIAALITAVRQAGQDSRLAPELAKELGIPVRSGEPGAPVKGRAYVEGKITRTAFVSADMRREYFLMIEENESGTVFLLLTPAGKPEKGLMNTVTNAALQPIPAGLVEQLSKQYVAIWQYLLKPQ